MVDLLGGNNAPGAKRTGFTRDYFEGHEQEKRERAKTEHGIALEVGEPVWKGDDPRWLMRPPYGFVPFTTRFGGACVYCGDKIPVGVRALYSRKLSGIAHDDCHAGFDREVPAGGVTVDEASGIMSKLDRLRYR
jgi:hypothetical protein